MTTFMAGKSRQLFILTALTIQLVKSQSPFYLVAKEDRGMYTEVGRFSPVSFALACAGFCIQTESCKMFVWYPESKDCSVGQVDAISQTGFLPTPPGPALFFRRIVHCLTSLGYELRYTVGHTPMCLKYVGEKKTKPEADAVCASLHGSLVRANTQDKIDLLFELSELDTGSTHFVFVDGGDKEKEGTFTWSNGVPFTQEEMELFLPMEPNGNIRENSLAAFNLQPSGLVDINSLSKFSFVCEMDIFP